MSINGVAQTLISMLGGSHVQRRSVGSMIEISSCIHMERRKRLRMHHPEPVFKRLKGDYETSDKSRIIETKPSIASTSSWFRFGDKRMIHMKHGLLDWQSL
ncbi:hypothetical protein SCLCIDRAFT_29011 [Scleroderma citrinum Foug A]|uniref:Uncharacterized protein n=1 Tax=Scleroderma citrinum Foug A TaxID=1036808 RepID=A0A0C3DLQ7_9AGAM|nr:hypothetical protein SCLCIDRAFT_29011 [Scleroderma citrinum Foug A]